MVLYDMIVVEDGVAGQHDASISRRVGGVRGGVVSASVGVSAVAIVVCGVGGIRVLDVVCGVGQVLGHVQGKSRVRDHLLHIKYDLGAGEKYIQHMAISLRTIAPHTHISYNFCTPAEL